MNHKRVVLTKVAKKESKPYNMEMEIIIMG